MAPSAIRGTTRGDYDYKRPGGGGVCDFAYDPGNPNPFPSPETDGRWGLSSPPVLDDWSHFYALDLLRNKFRTKGKSALIADDVVRRVVSDNGEGSSQSTPYHSAE